MYKNNIIFPTGCCHTIFCKKQKMVERVLEELPAIRRVLVQDRKHGHLNQTWQDVSVLEYINAAMKLLADFTDVLSGEKYVTVSSVKLVLELTEGDLLFPGPNDTALTASIKQNMCRVLKIQLTCNPRPSWIQGIVATWRRHGHWMMSSISLCKSHWA